MISGQLHLELLAGTALKGHSFQPCRSTTSKAARLEPLRGAFGMRNHERLREHLEQKLLEGLNSSKGIEDTPELWRKLRVEVREKALALRHENAARAAMNDEKSESL